MVILSGGPIGLALSLQLMLKGVRKVVSEISDSRSLQTKKSEANLMVCPFRKSPGGTSDPDFDGVHKMIGGV